ncbi:glycoside hydrolase family 88 protein [Rubritalea tangerina]|uniref:Glycoside hydrolase family 88 protein n=1 Tax=Rubritalea tangerina TaxID=430798 RepID=A0ABW4ZF58_9BACT
MTHSLTCCALIALSSLTLVAQNTPPAAEHNDQHFSADLSSASILKVTEAAAKWQLANPAKHPLWDWTSGALWTGYMAHAHTTGDETYYEALRQMAIENQYKLGPRKDFADDHCVGQAYLWLYLRDEIPHQIAHTKDTLTDFISRPHDEPLLWKNKIYLREPAWCDSLYMSPPTLAMLYAATGERKFLDSMDTLWWRTTDYLYDPESSLFWRDSNYFDRKEKNGQKVFWSRGNGWVFAGLCHILQYMPADYPSRPRYVKLFKEMAAKLKEIQHPDGSWHAALLDPDSFPAPESSGTAFYVYGMAWGINNGILSKSDYLPVCQKAWNRLVKNMHPSGKLGYVQAIGKDPQSVSLNETDVYGVGGLLSAGHELFKMQLLAGSKQHPITLTNPSSSLRLNKVLELPWSEIKAHLPDATPNNIAILDTISGYFLPIQNDGKLLLTQVSLMPKESRSLKLCILNDEQPKFFPSRLHARFVPERLDDFAWENDRMAFRMYGPALAAENARGGIDVWTKCVRYPIVDKWYAAGPSKYHDDHGEGMDAYKVGQTLGCGGLGYLGKSNKLTPSPVYDKSEVLATGPLRLKFKLNYPPLSVDKATISETRTLTMDAGEHFFHINSSFQVSGDTRGITPVTGIYVNEKSKLAETPDEAAQSIFQTNHAIATWELLGKPEQNYGFIGTAILTPKEGLTDSIHWDNNHPLITLNKDLSKPAQWFAGAAWSEVDTPRDTDFEHRAMQFTHDNFIHPIQVQF